MGVDIATTRSRIGKFAVCLTSRSDRAIHARLCQLIPMQGSLSFIMMLLLMAGIEPNPGPKDVFIFRYQYLLIEVGTTVLRRIFDIQVRHNFALYLASNSAAGVKLTELIASNIISKAQAQYLPPIDKNPVSANFDITLLACLLRNVCGLQPPKNNVWTQPGQADNSIEANIARLRIWRNMLMHSNGLTFTETEFDDKWKELSGILLSLNTACGIPDLSKVIDNAEVMDIDPELKNQLMDTYKAWQEADQDVMSKLDTVIINQHRMEQTLSTVKDQVQSVVQNVSTMNDELRQDMSAAIDERGQHKHSIIYEIRQNVSSVNDDVVKNVQYDVQSVKYDVKAVKDNVKTVKEDVKAVNDDIKAVKNDIRDLIKSFDSIILTDDKELGDVQDHKPTISDRESKDIKHKLTVIYQNECHALPITPFSDDNHADMLNIYQRPTMHECDTTNDSHEIITSYKDMFSKNVYSNKTLSEDCTSTCELTETCSTSTDPPQCAREECEQPLLLDVASSIMGNMKSDGARVLHVCDVDTTSRASSVCQNGEWSPAILNCFTGCVLTIPNGQLTFTHNTNLHATSPYTCDYGYEPDSTDLLTCLVTGQWGPGKCNLIDCGTILLYGQLLNTADTTVGASSGYTCNYGYHADDTSVTCQTDSQWGSGGCYKLATNLDDGTAYRIINQDNFRYWHYDTSVSQKWITTKWQPTDLHVKFTFQTVQLGIYKIVSMANGKALYEAPQFDYINTLNNPDDDRQHFLVYEESSSLYRIKNVASGKYVRADLDTYISSKRNKKDKRSLFSLSSS